MEELNTDRLIEYYFQRKLGGMDIAAIEQSISSQMLLDDERDVILSSIAIKEKEHFRRLKRSRNARIVLFTGLGLAAIGAVFFAFNYGKQQSVLQYALFYGTFFTGAILALGGVVLSRLTAKA